jgi:AraC-like DNA-binding protein
MLMWGSETCGTPGEHLAEIIYRENKWFDLPGAETAEPQRPRISASRWVGQVTDRSEYESSVEPDCHVLGIALRPMDEVTVFAARKLITSGPMPQGSMRVNEPGSPMRGIFRGAYDVLHLHIPNAIVAEYANKQTIQWRTTSFVTDQPVIDPIVEQLARSLIHAEALGGAFGQSYVDGIGLAIIAQLFGASADRSVTHGSRVSRLPRWRLKRATEYMAANLAEPIGLADIAAAAGLSRMHFAAQFRAVTGSRPHEYLTRQRVERAQELLLTSRQSLVEIAQDVGFKTQAHFTTVFRRFVSETPGVWRHRNKMGSSKARTETNENLSEVGLCEAALRRCSRSQASYLSGMA